ncbi:DUF2797 domain-containing protein [Labilibacter marinus]|uniref:DUF2797 domain-containing protein n=1 Tax=Labilibacter marinus TaxID=1477105 RepID=UPI00083768A1|nr:DUF2797 domain-containing protein [Labilibacter marinus]
MKYKGNISKMKSNLSNEVEYSLPIGNDLVELSSQINKPITLNFLNQINCIACGKITKKSFGQGFCYNCFASAPEASECILHPEKCQAHLGISRNMDWAEKHCLQAHIVYLAISSNLKVGITRKSQIPTRWIDQGASHAIVIAETPNRHIAGTIEKFLMQFYSDKTSWQAMLKGKSVDVDLKAEAITAINKLPKELQKYTDTTNEVLDINFPINEYPTKISSLSFDKTSIVEGVLKGIKGQYLYLNDNQVINIRKHTGYLIEMDV